MGFKITGNKINNSNRVYFIGEIGINHNGDINLAKKIILEAKKQDFHLLNFKKETQIYQHQKMSNKELEKLRGVT